MTPRVTNQPRVAADWTLGLTNQPRPQNVRVLIANLAKEYHAEYKNSANHLVS